MKISVCLIIKNERAHLSRWLIGVREIADEIIVVDTGSTDGGDIWLKSQADVELLYYPWNDDFSAARNFARDKAKGDWIVFLDADEYLSKDMAKRMKKNILAIDDDKKQQAFMCQIVNIDPTMDNRIINTAYIVRGFRNLPSIRYRGRVHEQLYDGNSTLQYIVGFSDVQILHTGYSNEKMTEKNRRNLKLIQEAIVNEGKKPQHYYFSLAEIYYGEGQWQKAILFAEEFIKSGLVAVGDEQRIYHLRYRSLQLARATSRRLLEAVESSIAKFPHNHFWQDEKQNLLATIPASSQHITACLIMKNEADNLPTWYKYLVDWVDEFVIIDTGSTDASKELAYLYTSNVYDYKWNDDFSAAKNFALQFAHGDWIVFLDADEYFPPNSSKCLINYLDKAEEQEIEGLVSKLINIDKDNGNSYQNSFYQMRIFRNYLHIHYEHPVHEMLKTASGGNLKMMVLPDDVYIYHTGYTPSVLKGKDKIKRNLDILLSDIAKNGENDDYLFYLLDSYYALGDYKKAIFYGKKALQKGVKLLGADNKLHLRLLQSMILNGSSEKEIFQQFDIAKENIAIRGDMLILEAEYCEKKKYYAKELKLLERAINYLEHDKNPKIQFSAWENPKLFVYQKLVKLYSCAGDYRKALTMYLKLLQDNKFDDKVLKEFYYLLKKKSISQQYQILSALYRKPDEKEFLYKQLTSYRAYTLLLQYGKKQVDGILFYLWEQGKYKEAFYLSKKNISEDYKAILQLLLKSTQISPTMQGILLQLPLTLRQNALLFWRRKYLGDKNE